MKELPRKAGEAVAFVLGAGRLPLRSRMLRWHKQPLQAPLMQWIPSFLACTLKLRRASEIFR